MVAPIERFQSPEEILAAEGGRRRLLAIRSAADYLGVSRATVERLVNRGELPIVKMAGSTRYDVEDLEAISRRIEAVSASGRLEESLGSDAYRCACARWEPFFEIAEEPGAWPVSSATGGDRQRTSTKWKNVLRHGL